MEAVSWPEVAANEAEGITAEAVAAAIPRSKRRIVLSVNVERHDVAIKT